MKCQHKRKVKVVLLFNGEYIEDGFTAVIEGCNLCHIDLEERKPVPQKEYICNMSKQCTRLGCPCKKEHVADDECVTIINGRCSRNYDAHCIEVRER